MSFNKTHTRNNSSNLIGTSTADALRSMGASRRGSYIHRTVKPSIDDLNKTLISKEKEKKKITEKTESRWGTSFSNVKSAKEFNNIVEAMAEEVKRDTKSVDSEIEHIKKILKGKGAIVDKSDKIDQEKPSVKKSMSLFGFLSRKQEPVRTSTTSLNKTYSPKDSSKILRSTSSSKIKETRPFTATNRSRFAKPI